MNALHRLKAYFGMVPAEDLDAAGFDAAEFGEYHPGYPRQAHDPDFDRAGTSLSGEHHHLTARPATRRTPRADLDHFDDSVPALAGHSVGHQSAGHHATPRMHPAQTPSYAMDSRVPDSRSTHPWGADAPVRGSLAINTAAESAMPQPFTPAARPDPLTHEEAHSLARIVTLHPHSYNEARPIGERYREGNPVIINLTAMEDRDAKRLVDFAAGLAFALRGSIDKVTNKVFLLSPPNLDVSAEDRRRIAEGRFFR
jgi:cell division inhibitor SepF